MNFSQWQWIGEWAAGTVTAVALSPNFIQDRLVLAATPAGLFRSTDGGEQWQKSHVGLTDPTLLTVAFAPLSPQAQPGAFASTLGGRLYRSDDGGLSWAELTAWAGLGQITELAISPHFPTDHTLFAATAEGVFRSQDGGLSWESSTFGLHDLAVQTLICAPDFARSEVLWAGTANGGLYRSRNAGRSWREMGSGLPDDTFTALVAAPSAEDAPVLYLATATSGLYHSTDDGATWSQVAAPHLLEGIACLVVLDAQTLIAGTSAGILHSSNGGAEWQAMRGGDALALSLAAAADGTLVAGLLGEGVACYHADSARWHPCNQGLSGHVPPLIWRGHHQQLSALDNAGVLAWSPDEGRTWQPLQPPEALIYPLAATLQRNELDSRLFVADDAGQLWQADLTDAAPVTWRAWPLADPPLPWTLIAALPGAAEVRLLLGETAGTLYQWDADRGLRALPAPWSGDQLLQILPTLADPSAWLAVTAQPNAQGNVQVRLWQTVDGGQTWLNLAQLESELSAVALAASAADPEGSIFLGTRNRLIRIFREQPGGEWRSAQSFLASEVNITAIVPSPTFAQDRQLWLATNRGVYASTDAGLTWEQVGEALAERAIVALFLAEPERPALAIELGGRVWRGR